MVLHAQNTPKAPGGIIRLRPVVVHKYLAVAVIAEERTTKFTDGFGCFYPAAGFGIEGPELLKLPVFCFG